MRRLVGSFRGRAALVSVVLAAAALLSSCLPADPAPPPPTTTTTTTGYVAPPVSPGFDACAAPSLATMGTWKASSPYKVAGVYIGGNNRGCLQPNLTSAWVTSVHGQGWRLLPIWVGPQASCTTLANATKLPADAGSAWWQGISEAVAAGDAAGKLGLGFLTPIYYDMEGYTRGSTCSASVQSFADGWVRQLNKLGYLGAMYSSLCSGILDVAASTGDSTKVPLNGVWIAAWNNTPNLTGFGPPCALADYLWSNHQRVHQYTGGHDETYGAVTINIDTNIVDGLTG